jgi:hypothetical protein
MGRSPGAGAAVVTARLFALLNVYWWVTTHLVTEVYVRLPPPVPLSVSFEEVWGGGS